MKVPSRTQTWPYLVSPALFLLALAPAAVPSSSRKAIDPLLPNGGFEEGLQGWTSEGAVLELLPDAATGKQAARVRPRDLRRSDDSFAIYRWPRPVDATTAGTFYRASGSVRSEVRSG